MNDSTHDDLRSPSPLTTILNGITTESDSHENSIQNAPQPSTTVISTTSSSIATPPKPRIYCLNTKRRSCFRCLTDHRTSTIPTISLTGPSRVIFLDASSECRSPLRSSHREEEHHAKIISRTHQRPTGSQYSKARQYNTRNAAGPR